MTILGIGIDLGGTKTAVALVSSNGQIVEKESFPTAPEEGFEPFLSRVKETYQQLTFKSTELQAKPVGLASPGPIDLEKGMMYDSPNLHWGDLPLVKRLEEGLGTKIFWQNDASAAAYAEYLFGAGQNSECMIYITISTGIGGGVVSNGQLLTGSKGNAAEFGHMPLVSGGNLCNCGKNGCWEAYASGTAIGNLATKVRGRQSTAQDVGAAWQKGEDWAEELIAETVKYSGQGVAIVMQTFDPDCLVFGGGVAIGLGRKYLGRIEREAKSISLNYQLSEVKFKLARLDSNSALIGAAALTF